MADADESSSSVHPISIILLASFCLIFLGFTAVMAEVADASRGRFLEVADASRGRFLEVADASCARGRFLEVADASCARGRLFELPSPKLLIVLTRPILEYLSPARP